MSGSFHIDTASVTVLALGHSRTTLAKHPGSCSQIAFSSHCSMPLRLRMRFGAQYPYPSTPTPIVCAAASGLAFGRWELLRFICSVFIILFLSLVLTWRRGGEESLP